MNLSSQKSAIALSASAAALLMPVSAFAEDGAAGADILIPKMAEFIPALIAFLIIWIVLAKVALPGIMKTMEERGKKIEESLDEAEKTKQELSPSALSPTRSSPTPVVRLPTSFSRPVRTPSPSAPVSSSCSQGGRGDHRQGPYDRRGRAQVHLRRCRELHRRPVRCRRHQDRGRGTRGRDRAEEAHRALHPGSR